MVGGFAARVFARMGCVDSICLLALFVALETLDGFEEDPDLLERLAFEAAYWQAAHAAVVGGH